MSGVSPCAAAGAGGAAVRAVTSASVGGGRAQSPASRLSGRRPGRAWERAHGRAPGDRLGPASSPGVKGNRSRNWPSALTQQQAGPRPGRSRQKIPSRPTGDPRQGRWSSRSAPMSRAAPHGDLQRRCHSWALAAQNSHTFFRAIPIPEMHREGNSGKGSPSLESLARSKATLGRNPIVCLLMSQSPPNLKECPPGTW